jgi:RND family efflux transporter MFP subunit
VASQAQVAAAQAQLAAAQADFDRRQKLYEQKFLSKAALDRAESDYKSAAAQARAQIAQANVAGVQTGLHTLTAPYNGVVAETNIELGDMVMPGKPLLAVYDPNALRVTVNLPQSQLANMKSAPVTVEIPGAKAPTISIAAGNVVALPTADPVSHMVQVRIMLPAKLENLTPGMFARALLPTQGAVAMGRITVPSVAVITRSELTAVYVVDNTGHASLRQVRLGRSQGDRIEVLAGLDAGEKIALDPLAAAKQR